MTHHEAAHGEENAEEGFQRPHTVLQATLPLQQAQKASVPRQRRKKTDRAYNRRNLFYIRKRETLYNLKKNIHGWKHNPLEEKLVTVSAWSNLGMYRSSFVLFFNL